ncbi:MAG: RidA family protein [Promethearchaeota archaeon]|jgi:2-iminobutanoate/2-iminopropanoate deaminase
MVKIEEIDTGTSKAGPYSLGIKAGNLIFTSGQVPSPGEDGIIAQTLSALEKIKQIIENAETTVSNIVKITIYIRNMSDFKEMNEAYKEFFNQNGITSRFPARTTVEATCPLKNALIEIDAIAVL